MERRAKSRPSSRVARPSASRGSGVEGRLVVAGCLPVPWSGRRRTALRRQRHAARQKGHFVRPAENHLGRLLMFGYGLVIVLELAGKFLDLLVGPEQLIDISSSGRKPKTVARRYQNSSTGPDAGHDPDSAGPPPVPLAPEPGRAVPRIVVKEACRAVKMRETAGLLDACRR